jgi:hypothetical protein
MFLKAPLLNLPHAQVGELVIRLRKEAYFEGDVIYDIGDQGASLAPIPSTPPIPAIAQMPDPRAPGALALRSAAAG